jgi:hypothetical protein
MYFRTVYPLEKAMRKSYYFGRTVGAKVTELRRGSVNNVSIGCVERNPIDGSIKLRPSCRMTGKPAKALAATLSEISIACARGEITMAQRCAQFDAAIINRAPERPVLKTPPKVAPEIGGNAGLRGASFGCPTTTTFEDLNMTPTTTLRHRRPSGWPQPGSRETPLRWQRRAAG